MSYLALARKWRPRRFEDVRGQGHVVKALTHALDGDKLHPAILLTGTRGVGKTTLARIIAKGLNCQTGVSANPCGICSACKEVNDGRFVDLLEIDAASNTGVDNIRELIDNAQYSPARGRYKVYLIDEVHMLSKGAFNALLKTLEEPPPHVKFILATTDPQKLPITVLSRCLQFNLKRLSVAMIRDNLADILKDESVEFETAAITELARAADGSMRDGLSLLDQALVFAGGARLEAVAIEEMLGTGGRRNLLDVIDALAAHDAAGLLAALRRLDESAPDFQALLNDLAAALQRIAMLQLLPGSGEDDDDPRLAPLAGTLAVDDVQLWYQTAVLGRRDLPYAPDPRLGFEMTVLRMFALRLDDSAPAAPAAGGGGKTVSMPSAAPARSASAPATRAAEIIVPTPVIRATENPSPSGRGAGVRDAANPAAPTPVAATSTAETWHALVDTLGLDGMTRQFARHCAWLSHDAGVLRFALDPRAKHLQTEERRAAVEAALSERLGALKLEVEPIAVAGQLHPAALDEQKVVDRQRDAEKAIEQDPVVASFRTLFGATVRAGSIQPIDPTQH
ncbi:DNA polymerase III subunit gamma/tau [Nevskia sp.]|uniref:DNA polymerase III subunit gamma/tau n=1 Tax=Nevskia sp. TaxID=1929292 RepID=UPI0025F5D20A|nr:DNA polymerase III subunit gamma/tau [Nevskia sp.]